MLFRFILAFRTIYRVQYDYVLCANLIEHNIENGEQQYGCKKLL